MIDLTSIVFCLMMFISIWFAIFKFKLIYDSKKILKNIESKIDNQNKNLFMYNKNVRLADKIALPRQTKEPEEAEVPTPEPEELKEVKENEEEQQ